MSHRLCCNVTLRYKNKDVIKTLGNKIKRFSFASATDLGKNKSSYECKRLRKGAENDEEDDYISDLNLNLNKRMSLSDKKTKRFSLPIKYRHSLLSNQSSDMLSEESCNQCESCEILRYKIEILNEKIKNYQKLFNMTPDVIEWFEELKLKVAKKTNGEVINDNDYSNISLKISNINENNDNEKNSDLIKTLIENN